MNIWGLFHGEAFFMNLWGLFSEKKSWKKMSRNEPGSRISSNLRTPDHLGRIPSPDFSMFFRKFSMFFRTEIVFFDRFSRFFKPGNTPRMILNDFGETSFADFRRFSSDFSGGRPIFIDLFYEKLYLKRLYLYENIIFGKIMFLWKIIIFW